MDWIPFTSKKLPIYSSLGHLKPIESYLEAYVIIIQWTVKQ